MRMLPAVGSGREAECLRPETPLGELAVLSPNSAPFGKRVQNENLMANWKRRIGVTVSAAVPKLGASRKRTGTP
jgi:hypothetical protein